MKTKKARLTKLEEARALRGKVASLQRDLRIERGARARLECDLRAVPGLERARIAMMAHRQLAKWATLAALTGEHVEDAHGATVPIADLVAWFDALSPVAVELRGAIERRQGDAGDARTVLDEHPDLA